MLSGIRGLWPHGKLGPFYLADSFLMFYLRLFWIYIVPVQKAHHFHTIREHQGGLFVCKKDPTNSCQQFRLLFLLKHHPKAQALFLWECFGRVLNPREPFDSGHLILCCILNEIRLLWSDCLLCQRFLFDQQLSLKMQRMMSKRVFYSDKTSPPQLPPYFVPL